MVCYGIFWSGQLSYINNLSHNNYAGDKASSAELTDIKKKTFS